MKGLMRLAIMVAAITAFALAIAVGADPKETGASIPAQSAADVLMAYAQSDGAFLAAGILKDNAQANDDLSQLLLYPEDQLMIVKLKGSQIKEAFERSVSLYPQPNTSFLQLAGFDVTFSKSAPPGKRVTSILAKGSQLSPTTVYTIAMPASLARGGLGYFKIWDKPDITKTFDVTVESILKGKPKGSSSPRWSASP